MSIKNELRERIITIRNQAYFAKLGTCGLQEGIHDMDCPVYTMDSRITPSHRYLFSSIPPQRFSSV